MYFYGPVGCLLIVNFASFAWTSVGLFRLQKSLSPENGPSSSSGKHLWRRHSKNRCQAKLNDVKQRLCLHLKLFGVMGLSWAFELLAWAFGTTSSSSDGMSTSSTSLATLEDGGGTSMSGGCWSWYFITDMINALQGLWIFIIYVVKKDVIKKLWDKICKNNPLRIHARTPTKAAEAASGGSDMNAEAATEAVAVATTTMRLSTITKIPSSTKDVLANNSS